MLGDEKLWVRGVTYGTFRPGADGTPYPVRSVVERDFAAMAANGFNTVRVYTVPPRWLLDVAASRALRVMVGVPWEQHVTFLDDRRQVRDIERRVRAGAREVAGHPALLCLAIGNEIPAPIVRWHGAHAIADHLERLYEAVKEEDPDALVTYVNYPTTEYLELPFLDLVCFNVYLESRERLTSYLARLHNIAGDRPLLMGEIGLDSLRNGEEGQAASLAWQLRTVFEAGTAGAFVFTWTDEWHRGGYDIDDWAFGLTRSDRTAKPALGTVREALAELPFPKDRDWPMISVVVCSYNGARTIGDCLEGLNRLDYPRFEVTVVDDGSTDATASIAHMYGTHVISTPNQGLSAARNVGLAAATGEIIAYTDDDARPDPHWLTYLAATFMQTSHAAVGGPNIAPPGDGTVAACVANAPGGPVHVLISDTEAEHVPGCNMAFRKSALEAIGGFDPRFRRAGDDVDVCWRLLEAGFTIGFSGAAMVWHHRRNSLRAYVRQQLGYGEAEALLEAKWPEKYNAAGHVAWTGRLYGKGLAQSLARRARIYHGTWGQALFQSVYEPASHGLAAILLMPEWYLALLVLAGLTLLGVSWSPLLYAFPLLTVGLCASVAQAALSGAQARFNGRRSALARFGLYELATLLHLVQPLARLRGRIRFGLTPWRRRGRWSFALPRGMTWSLWSEHGWPSERWLRLLEEQLRVHGAPLLRGGDYDRWDVEVRGGSLGRLRVLVTTEDHGGGKQLVRFRVWPRAVAGLVVSGVLATLAVLSGLDGGHAACVVLGVLGILAAARAYRETAAAMAEVRGAVDTLAEQLEPSPTHSPTTPEPVAPEGVAPENVASAA
jgi:GT2 family glycosyltransferase